MYRVHAPAAEPPSIVLSPEEGHHLVRVLRLGVGADVAVFDGRGHEWRGRIASASPRSVRIDLVEPRTPLAEPPVVVTLALGLLKGDQMDAVVRDATMLGVARIVPIDSTHVALPARARARVPIERWARIAVASAKQCGRAVVPAIEPIRPFADVVADGNVDLKVICVEPAHAAHTPSGHLSQPHRALVLVGPEGGWSDAEVAIAERGGARSLGLGPRTLRAETAPTVALSALWTMWGWG